MTSMRMSFSEKDANTLKGRQWSSARPQISKGMDRIGRYVARQVVIRKLGGNPVGIRTGRLASSLSHRLVQNNGRMPSIDVGVFSGPALRYAGVIEYGTRGKNPLSPYPTIVPKNAKALTIPVGDALTPSGVARAASAREFEELYEPLRAIYFRRPGRIIGKLVKVDDESSRPAAVYLLATAVDIEPRWYLRDGVGEQMPMIQRDVAKLVSDSVYRFRRGRRG